MENIKELNEIGLYDKMNDFFYDLSPFANADSGELSKIIFYLNEMQTEINGIELFYSDISTGIFHNPTINTKIDNQCRIEVNLRNVSYIKGTYFSNKIIKLLFVNNNNEELGFNAETKYDLTKVKPKEFKMTLNNDTDKLISFKLAFNKNLTYFAKITKKINNEDDINPVEGKNCYASKLFGKQFNDTKMQEIDYSDLACQQFKIKNITIYHDGGLVYGTKTVYLLNNGQERIVNFGRVTNMAETLSLSEGEYISNIILRTGDLVDSVAIFTNRQNGIIAGGNGGGVHKFDLSKLKQEKNISDFVGFDGGFTGLLHRIRVYFR